MTLQGQGATPERLGKSKIERRVRGTTRGGIPDSFGHEDTEHCALDILLNKGFIEQDQYDAGYQLRKLYYTFTQTGRWIDEGGRGYSGDGETDQDRAEARYNAALRSVDMQYRQLARAVCIEDTYIPADWMLIQSIQYGLGDLENFFKKS